MLKIKSGRYWSDGITLRYLLVSRITSLAVRIRHIVLFHMTIKAKGFTVRNFVSQSWEVGKFFNMVSVKISTSIISATAAHIIISLKNSSSPTLISWNASCHPNFGSNSAFPVWIIGTIKVSATIFALFNSERPKKFFVFVTDFSTDTKLIPSYFFQSPFSFLGREFMQSWRSINSYAGITFNTKPIITRIIGGKFFFDLPRFAFLATLTCFNKRQIFAVSQLETSGRSSKCPFFWCMFSHNFIPIYHGGN